jgi:hypothetical protein
MKLFLISQDKNRDYGTYYAAVVAAQDEAAARATHPRGEGEYDLDSWCEPEDVKVELIGTAKRGMTAKVICASFFDG